MRIVKKRRRSNLTFLPLVEDGWARVIVTLFLCVRELFAAALANTLLRHGEAVEMTVCCKERISCSFRNDCRGDWKLCALFGRVGI